jgi:hypothetical protein
MASTDQSTGINLACSFCMKPPAAVRTVVLGPGVCVCDECVDLCAQIVAERREQPPGPSFATWQPQMSDEELLGHLPKVAAAQAQVERQLTDWVRQARGRGITWTRIGEALGMTRQSAWERFSGEE